MTRSKKLNTLYSDKLIDFAFYFLLLIGSVMIVSITVGETSAGLSIIFKTIFKQGFFVVIALIFLKVMTKKFSFNFFKNENIVHFLMLLFLLLPRVFSHRNGSYNWIPIGSLATIQPSELFKVYIIVYSGYVLDYYSKYENKKGKMDIAKEIIFKISKVALIGIAIIFLVQKDLGTGVVCLGITWVCLIAPAYPYLSRIQALLYLFIITMVTFTIMIAIIFIHLQPQEAGYKVMRLLSTADPFKSFDKAAGGAQLVYGILAIANGGLFGRGLGNSLVKYIIPDGTTDFIAPLIIEELGVIGFMVIISVMLSIVFLLFRYAFKTKKESYRILFVGTASYIMIHFIFNLGGVSGFIPLTGVPLLFISQGGSSLVAITLAIGCCQHCIAKMRLQKRSV